MASGRDPETGRRPSLYAAVAAAAAAIVLLGFTPTYWWPVVRGRVSLPPLVHLHAALFFGWAVLFALQAALVSRGRVSLHRRVGIAGAVWSAAAVVVGLRLALLTIARDLDTIDGTRGAILTVIPLSQIAMFAGFAGLGLARARDGAVHKRFMTLAALVAVTPALARVGTAVLGRDAVALPLVVFLASTGLLVGVAWYDARRCRRLHPVFAWGGATIVLVRLARVPFAMSESWRATAEAFARWAA